MTFSGKDDSYAQIANNGLLDAVYSFTIMLDVYPDEDATVPILDFGEFGVAIGQYRRNIQAVLPERGATRIIGNDKVNTGGSPLTLSEWNNVAVTYDFTTGSVCIYINGVKKKEHTLSERTVATNGNLKIARMRSNKAFKGAIACLKVYDGLLTDEDITSKQACTIRKFFM